MNKLGGRGSNNCTEVRFVLPFCLVSLVLFRERSNLSLTSFMRYHSDAVPSPEFRSSSCDSLWVWYDAQVPDPLPWYKALGGNMCMVVTIILLLAAPRLNSHHFS